MLGRFSVASVAFQILFSIGCAQEIRAFKSTETIQIDSLSQPLVLNGQGERIPFIFVGKIYDIALYLPERSGNVATILSPELPKMLEIVFSQDSKDDHLRSGWMKAFERNCANLCDSGRPGMERFVNHFQKVSKGEQIRIELTLKEVRIFRNRVQIDHFDHAVGSAFGICFLRMYLGDSPIEESIKSKLLGKN